METLCKIAVVYWLLCLATFLLHKVVKGALHLLAHINSFQHAWQRIYDECSVVYTFVLCIFNPVMSVRHWHTSCSQIFVYCSVVSLKKKTTNTTKTELSTQFVIKYLASSGKPLLLIPISISKDKHFRFVWSPFKWLEMHWIFSVC